LTAISCADNVLYRLSSDIQLQKLPLSYFIPW
jgi:hypothetical protein